MKKLTVSQADYETKVTAVLLNSLRERLGAALEANDPDQNPDGPRSTENVGELSSRVYAAIFANMDAERVLCEAMQRETAKLGENAYSWSACDLADDALVVARQTGRVPARRAA